MRKMKILTIVIAMLLGVGQAMAYPDKYFYSSGEINDCEHWENVFIYNDDTVVDMFGGDVDSIGTYDSSTVNVTGGQVSLAGGRTAGYVAPAISYTMGLGFRKAYISGGQEK